MNFVLQKTWCVWCSTSSLIAFPKLLCNGTLFMAALMEGLPFHENKFERVWANWLLVAVHTIVFDCSYCAELH